ncbi:hypothetical protein ASG36_11545 [Geodermatophilus sp. Leaf369]|uniref:class I adenylate-forming enzyme family protein n=1 Tax=Geodermatophilus sp. Leaf369 TaxID=1736354 RepID=UPI0006F7C866|nr:AMP-binding protein [Geodermatophilus sp. Leaf369]KQS58657.1 hypothetical protein ASG36_11545 [Geodermatophilus sp. Leaf369]
MGLGELFDRRAAARPDHPGLTSDGVTTDLAELSRRSTAVGRALVAHGLRPGDRVALLAHNSAAYVDLLLGAGRAGVALVTVNWRLAAAEVAPILADAGASLVVVDAATAHLVDDSLPVVDLDRGWEDWLAVASGTEQLPGARPEDPAVLIYTSGTTGLPKGVVLSHASVAHAGRLMAEVYDCGPDDTMLVALPLFHVGGLAHLLGPLLQGGHVVLTRAARPAETVELLARHRVTHAFFVPSVIATLLEVPGIAELDLSAFRTLAYGAAPITAGLVAATTAVLGCGLLHAYGLTEAGGTVTALRAPAGDAPGLQALLDGSVGAAVPWAEIRAVDPATGRPVDTGETGELWVRSDAVMTRYWGKPEETARTLTADGWLRTGDVGHLDAAGRVVVRDRLKDMIISGGENVFPAEVDAVLARHPAVAEVAVIGVPDERWGETVKAVVALRPDVEVTAAELIAFTRQHLAHYKCPTSVDVVPALPRNAAGKVRKVALRRPYLVDSSR